MGWNRWKISNTWGLLGEAGRERRILSIQPSFIFTIYFKRNNNQPRRQNKLNLSNLVLVKMFSKIRAAAPSAAVLSAGIAAVS